MRRSLGLLLLALALFTGLTWYPADTVRGQVAVKEPLRTAADRPIDIRHLRLDLRVDLANKSVDSLATLHVRAMRPLASVSLDAAAFQVKGVTLQKPGGAETPAHFSHDGHKLAIDLAPSWLTGQETTLRITYRIHEPKDGLYFFGPTPEEPDVPLTVWSQGEPEANRYWIPCLDEPDQRQTTEMVATVPEGFEVLSNGKLLERRSNADRTVTFHWLQDRPHVSYLITLVVGRFDIIQEEWDHIPVLYYVPVGHKDEIPSTFGKTREMLSFFSQRFGIHYPWDKYAQVIVEQFTMGGMENTSATSLVDGGLHDKRSLLDDTPEGLISHEMAHQWWGDLVTCKDWAHIWLNEGFASYAEALWDEHSRGADEYAYNMLQKARAAIKDAKTRPVVDHRYPNAWSMFDARAYPKGAWLLHMLRRRLGDEAFFRSLQRWGTEHRLQCVETSDFRETLEKETGRSLERFFYDWTERPGNPTLDLKTDYLPETKQVRVQVKQTQASEAFHFPLVVALRCPSEAKPTILRQEVTDKEQTFLMNVPDRPTLIEVDPEQAVLAEINETKGRDLWLGQLHDAASVPARIRAVEYFSRSKTPADGEVLANALPQEKFWGVQVETVHALGEIGGSPAREALLTALHHADARVRKAAEEQLAKFASYAKVAQALHDVLEKGDPSYGVETAALSAYARTGRKDAASMIRPWVEKPSFNEVLRDAALQALGETHDPSTLDTLVAWTKRGKPRTCREAAVHGLARFMQSGNPSEEQRERILTAITACLQGEGRRLRTSVIKTLGDMGKLAAPALTRLDSLGKQDKDESVQKEARQAAEKIRKDLPAAAELDRLREDFKQMKRDQEKLEQRLNRLQRTAGVTAK
jgi:aminopeptidase N